MKESVYINQERREALRREWATMDRIPPVSREEKLRSIFESREFPDRECLPVKRRRSRREIEELVEEWTF